MTHASATAAWPQHLEAVRHSTTGQPRGVQSRVHPGGVWA